jgi:hypothetical protein
VNPLDEMPEHHFGDVEIGDNAIPKRANGLDVPGSPA